MLNFIAFFLAWKKEKENLLRLQDSETSLESAKIKLLTVYLSIKKVGLNEWIGWSSPLFLLFFEDCQDWFGSFFFPLTKIQLIGLFERQGVEMICSNVM